jgi:P-type E1-E2 ATPase
LIQEADAMERASRLDVVMFDKTGTLTTGLMAVEAVIGDDPRVVLAAAAAITNLTRIRSSVSLASRTKQKEVCAPLGWSAITFLTQSEKANRVILDCS